jgi:hypothetical protein
MQRNVREIEKRRVRKRGKVGTVCQQQEEGTNDQSH